MSSQFLTKTQLSLFKIEQALKYLQAGLPVIIDHMVIFSLETINHKIKKLLLYDNIAEEFLIVISATRANFLFDTNKITPTSILYPKDSLKLSKILLSNEKLNKADYIFSNSNQNYDLSLELTKIAYLLPIIITADQFTIKKNIIKNAVSISSVDIINYKKNISNSLLEIASTDLVLKNVKKANLIIFKSYLANLEHYVIIIGNKDCNLDNPIVRIHSSCFTGDVLSSLYCDCGDQFNNAIQYMEKNGGGIILYLMQEGRSIGLVNKIRAYNLKNYCYDTVEANEILGFKADERDYLAACAILKKLNINKIRLITNNPAKIKFLSKYQIKISEIINYNSNINPYNEHYLETKITKMGHNKKYSNLISNLYK